MEVKRGYKQTEVGVIPEDWDVKGDPRVRHNAKRDRSAPYSKLPSIQMEMGFH